MHPTPEKFKICIELRMVLSEVVEPEFYQSRTLVHLHERYLVIRSYNNLIGKIQLKEILSNSNDNVE